MHKRCTYGSVRGARGNSRPYRDKGFAGNGLLDQTASRFSREFLENRYHREIRDRPETPQNMGNLALGWTENPTLSSISISIAIATPPRSVTERRPR